MEENNKGTATNKDGQGSTYAGTQSPDPNAPDAYQKPKPGKDADNTDQTPHDKLGAEYDDDSSYGDQESDPASSASRKTETDGDNAAGSPVRDQSESVPEE